MGRLLDEGDVIDAIYKALRTPLPDYRKDPFHDSMGVAIAMANEIPPAQPGRKKGKWIRITQGATPEQYICPFCHRTVEAYGVEELVSIRYPYCHCGADMRGE